MPLIAKYDGLAGWFFVSYFLGFWFFIFWFFVVQFFWFLVFHSSVFVFSFFIFFFIDVKLPEEVYVSLTKTLRRIKKFYRSVRKMLRTSSVFLKLRVIVVEAPCHLSPWPPRTRTLILRHTSSFWQISEESFCLLCLAYLFNISIFSGI